MDNTTEYISWPYIKENAIEKREYQTKLAKAGIEKDSLIAIPTGRGKTVISVLITARRLSENRGKRAVVLAPTKPLVEQHLEEYREFLDIPETEIEMFTGDTRPAKREEKWSEPLSVVIATPQVIENDLVAGRISFEDVVHLTFDECHRGTGNYAYTYIAEQYLNQSKNPLVTGLSASPGSDRNQILDVCSNLHLSNVEIVTDDDPLLEPYVYEVDVEYTYIDLPEKIEKAIDALEEEYTDRLKTLKEIGVTDSRRKNISMGELEGARKKAQELISKDDSDGYKAMSLYSEVMKLRSILEALETQGVESALASIENQKREAERSNASKSVKRLVSSAGFQRAIELLQGFEKTHPKKEEMRDRVINTLVDGGQALIFTESRDTATAITEYLNQYNMEAKRFVGQNDRQNDTGLSQTEQKEILDEFRAEEIDVLVATSVAEEGLDIPSVDLVLFYEPVPSGIRTIQRSGRTGRESEGEVVVLVAKGTRDEGYMWAAKNKQQQMEEDMKELKQMEGDIKEELEERAEPKQTDGENASKSQADLTEFKSDETEESTSSEYLNTIDDLLREATDIARPSFSESEEITIICDSRESSSNVPKELSLIEGVNVQTETLEVGDYVVSTSCAVERKSMDDFADTLTGERSLFEQIGDMVNNYDASILLLEGDINELFNRNIHPNAIRGALTSLVLDFGVSVLVSRSEEETANYLVSFAKREQLVQDGEVAAHGNKSTKSLAEEQKYIVSSIAEVGPVIAENLLERFGTVRDVMTASKSELMEVENVGATKAEQIITVLTEKYD